MTAAGARSGRGRSARPCPAARTRAAASQQEGRGVRGRRVKPAITEQHRPPPRLAESPSRPASGGTQRDGHGAGKDADAGSHRPGPHLLLGRRLRALRRPVEFVGLAAGVHRGRPGQEGPGRGPRGRFPAEQRFPERARPPRSAPGPLPPAGPPSPASLPVSPGLPLLSRGRRFPRRAGPGRAQRSPSAPGGRSGAGQRLHRHRPSPAGPG